MMKRLVVSIGFLFLFLFTPTFAQDVPQFEVTDCPAEARLPAGFRCGYVTVLADRSKPDGDTLRLMVAIYHSDRKNTQPDPLIFLNGGPGVGTIIGGRDIMRVFGNFADRDIVLFDQRGTGYSEPNLACPEIFEAFDAALEQKLSPETMRAQSVEPFRACHDRLLAEGVNFSVFSSAASAADAQDIRRALGYDQVNLYGISYGTRLALTIMRDHPEGIRSVILDSVYPPNVDLTLDGAVNTQATFDRVFAACAADETCNKQYPDLESVFYEVVDALNTNPVEVKLPPRTLPMDGYGFMAALYSWLYNAAIIPDVPRLIYQLKAGDTSGLTPIIRFTMPLPGMSYPMSYSVQCGEELPFTDDSQVESRLSALQPVVRDWVQSNYESGAAICDFWGVPALNPLENEAVISDIPALVLSGEFDPITPPSFGQLAARTLSHSYEIEIPATGHGALAGNLGMCAILITGDFLNDPTQTPEDTCPAAMPFQFD